MPDKISYLTIHPTTHKAAIRARKRIGCFCIPLSVERGELPSIHSVVYETFYAQLGKRRAVFNQTSHIPACSIAPPDPLTASVAILIWQGIVQGAAWDSIKVLLSSFLAMSIPLLQSRDVQKSSHWRLSGGLSTPRGQYSFFLELKRAAMKRPPEDRQAVLDGVLHQPKLRPARQTDRKAVKQRQS
jgi:hypothetical protein